MPTSYRFGHFHLLPDQRMLLAGDTPLKLGSRAFDMLVALVQRHDRCVDKHELMDLVWPKLVVEENNLQVQVASLRKLLGHVAISTVPGRGYRFTVPLLDAGSGPSPSQPAAQPRPSNLPERTQPLLGREDELQTLSSLLDEHGLVTVAGTGGIGKTRLAQSAAASHLARQNGGVWWVELAGLNDPALVTVAVARALGLSLEGASDTTQAVMQALHGRAALLVLDNAEHLLEGVAAFAAAVREHTSGVKLLVTSQEVLRALDEQVFRPGPLALPLSDDLAGARASGAVALFVARARQADPRFDLHDGNRAEVIDICRRLDGIPLAIELAAARLPLLGVDGVRARLDERFQVLTAGARAVMRRHQTLRAALEWSHSMLSVPEQVVLRRLGVFAGGFTLEAAQDVVDDEAIDRWDVLEHLGALVDKSMVVAEGDPVPRYRLLETTKLYALERLAEAGETDVLLRRHARYGLTLAEAFDVETVQQGQAAEALARLDLERDNLLHALAWCGRDGDAEGSAIGLRMAAALRHYWPSRGQIGPGLGVTRTALERANALPGDSHRCKALGAAAQMSHWLGRSADAEMLVRELLALGQAIDFAPAISSSHFQLGYLALDDRNWAAAQAHFEAMREAARRMGSLHHEGNAIGGLIDVLRRQGRLDEATAQVDELLGLRRRAAHGYNLAVALHAATSLALARGKPDQAWAWLGEAQPWVRRAGSQSLAWNWCGLVARAALLQPDCAAAVTVLAATQRQHKADGLQVCEDDERELQTVLAASRNALGHTAYDRAIAAGQSIRLTEALALATACFEAQP